jgi:hypothetical protein
MRVPLLVLLMIKILYRLDFLLYDVVPSSQTGLAILP